MTDAELFDAFLQDLKGHTPKLAVKYKSESWLMKVLGVLLKPVNPTFMTSYITTLGNTVYYPDRKFVKSLPVSSVAVLAHEFVHLSDEKTEGFWKYHYSYLAPQLLGVLTLGVFSAVFSIWPLVALAVGYLGCCLVPSKSKGFSLALLGLLGVLVLALAWLTSGFFGTGALLAALLPLVPWPSKGRTRLELRGYTMTVAVHRWLYGTDLPMDYLEYLVSQFTGSSYYFMSWSAQRVRNTLIDAITLGKDGSLLSDTPYGIVHHSLERHGRLRA